ncbi:HU family DNA-binding protein [Parasedimentitalea marina]|nr:HU family DNA-binding protein [Parasedimentitalea marina]
MATSTTKRSSAGKSVTSGTTTAKTTTPKTPSRAGSTPGPKASPKVAKVVPTEAARVVDPVVSEPPVDAADLPMRKKELIDLVVERSGIKKKDAKPVVEAMLAVLGEAVGRGRELNMQPLGKLRINRSIERSNGRIVVCKLRQSTATTENSTAADNTTVGPIVEDGAGFP